MYRNIYSIISYHSVSFTFHGRSKLSTSKSARATLRLIVPSFPGLNFLLPTSSPFPSAVHCPPGREEKETPWEVTIVRMSAVAASPPSLKERQYHWNYLKSPTRLPPFPLAPPARLLFPVFVRVYLRLFSWWSKKCLPGRSLRVEGEARVGRCGRAWVNERVCVSGGSLAKWDNKGPVSSLFSHSPPDIRVVIIICLARRRVREELLCKFSLWFFTVRHQIKGRVSEESQTH